MTESFFEFREKMTQRVEAIPAAPPVTGKPLTVSQLTRQIDRALRDNLPQTLAVTGEASNFSAHASSGHFYFTMKDADACIDCVMFRSDAARVKFTPKDGMELLASGAVKVWAPRGRYQLYVTRLEPLGQGALELAFQQLRAKLDGDGLFEQERKRPIPPFPLRIALVTAQQAAALHDMLKVLRRFPWLSLFVYPVPVQGDGAAAKIAAALRHLNKHAHDVGGIDVIVLARGGGSLEDLWAFNEEAVARAVAASHIPVVTGIGHEVDVSIADLVADYHAHTPTEAAQILTANWRNVPDAIDTMRLRLARMVRDQLARDRQILDGIARHEFFRRPMDTVNTLRQLVDDRQRAMIVAMNSRLWNLQRDLQEIDESLRRHSPAILVARLKQRLMDAQQHLHYAGLRRLRLARQAVGRAETGLAAKHPRHAFRLAEQRLSSVAERIRCAAAVQRERRRALIDSLERELRAVSPESVLRRGFSMTTLKRDGKVVRSVAQVKGGEKLVTRLADGTIESVAEDPLQPKLFE